MRNVLAMAGLLTTVFFVPACNAMGTLATDSPSDPASETLETIHRGFDYMQHNDLSSAASTLDEAIKSPGFASLPDDTRYQALSVAGQLDEENEDHAAAYPLLVRATEFEQADSVPWHKRLSAAFAMDNFRDSALCITAIAQRWPDTLDRIKDQAIYLVKYKLDDDKADRDVLENFLQSLFDAKWVSEDGVTSDFWLDLTRILLAKNDVTNAALVAARIDSARAVVQMRIDKTFDRLTQGHSDAYDVDRVAADELAQAKTRADAAPDELKPKMVLQGLQLGKLQFEQALAVSDEVIAKVKGGDGATAYKDFDDNYIWVLDNRARALKYLGRWDEAGEQLARAARRPEQGEMNVSQVLNAGVFYAYHDKPKEALDTVSELGPASPYGRMVLEGAELAVAVQMQDKAEIAKHIAYMREHREDQIQAWEEALLITGDLDGAAALLVERLNREKWRGDALVDMQDYAEVKMSPLETVEQERWHQVLARPEVIKALARFGRIEHFNLKSPEN